MKNMYQFYISDSIFLEKEHVRVPVGNVRLYQAMGVDEHEGLMKARLQAQVSGVKTPFLH